MSTGDAKRPFILRRVWRAYRVELFKARRRKFTYLGPVLVTLAVIAVAVIRKLAESEFNETSGYSFIAYATPLALNLLGLLLLLMYSAGLMSTEIGSGSIRMVLVKPLRRYDLVFAKVLLAMTYASAMTFCAVAASWTAAWLLGPLEGIVMGDEILFPAREMAASYALGALLVLLPQFAAAAFAVMISSFTGSSGGAVTGVVGIWILADILKYPLGIDRYIFSTYLEMPWRVFLGRCNGMNPPWFPDAGYCIGTSLGAFVLFTAVAAVVLSRKDFRV